MKVFLNRPSGEHSPSQGQNAGSIPAGSTMVPGAKYWGRSETPDGDVFEILHFVGRKVTQPGYVFEDSHGDLHILSEQRVLYAPEGMLNDAVL